MTGSCRVGGVFLSVFPPPLADSCRATLMLYICKSKSLLQDKSAAALKDVLPSLCLHFSLAMSLLGDQQLTAEELGGDLQKDY